MSIILTTIAIDKATPNSCDISAIIRSHQEKKWSPYAERFIKGSFNPCLPNVIFGNSTISLSSIMLYINQLFCFDIFRTLFLGLENSDTLKCWSSIFPTTLIHVGQLEDCWNNISMYGCYPIQGQVSSSC